MRILVPALGVPLILILLFVFLPGLADRPWTGLRIAGAIGTGLSYALLMVARAQLGEAFAVMPEAKILVTHGLYSRFTSPMYLFLDLTLAGLIVTLEQYWLFAILAVIAAIQTRQAGRETTVLREKFGQEYVNYRKSTWF